MDWHGWMITLEIEPSGMRGEDASVVTIIMIQQSTWGGGLSNYSFFLFPSTTRVMAEALYAGELA